MAKRKRVSVPRSGKKAKYSLGQIMSPDFELPEDREELIRVYRTMAKAADTRLARLEEYSQQEGYKDALKWAYAKGKRFIKEWSGPDAEWFNTRPPEGDVHLKQKMADIKTFLSSVTSTKTGIKEVHQKRADKLNKDWGTDFTWKDVGEFFQSELYEKMERDSYSSKTILRVVGRMRRQKKEIINAIKDANEKHLKLGGDMTDRLVMDTIEGYGPEVLDYLRGNGKRTPS